MWRRFKFGSALAILLVLTGAPALNCMSVFYKMDMQEMACCKHMAGDCDMGTQQDSCCQSSSSPYASHATIASKRIQSPVPTLSVELVLSASLAPVASRPVPAEASDGSPPPIPPASTTILRV